MPLLKNKTLEKSCDNEFLRDEEEVFHCVMTNEIFRNYDEFAERTLLCNSLVWTCSMTGKSQLTYEEALQSEKNARRQLRDFPAELKVPTLFIANMMRMHFGDLCDEVHAFIRCRYFVGEVVQACVGRKNVWADYRVEEVIPPLDQQEHSLTMGIKYKLHAMDVKDANAESVIAESEQVRRKRHKYSKDKSKLFLKQHVEQVAAGIIGVKKSSLDAFGINNLKFSDIFVGDPPTFKERAIAGSSGAKKMRQDTLASFLSKNNIVESAHGDTNVQRILEREKEREEARLAKLMRREKAKQLSSEVANRVRDWNNVREDLLLEDHLALPTFKPLSTKIEMELLGDALEITEFMRFFANSLDTRKYFPSGINLQTMEKILYETRVASPMNAMVQLCLKTIFKQQYEERYRYEDKRINVSDATAQADFCQSWCTRRFGLRILDLPLDVRTCSEVLRFHLLGSGESSREGLQSYRIKQRGGYESSEDPGVEFRANHAHILRALRSQHVCQLSAKDKLAILRCLMHQLLTYADFRNASESIIEENRLVRAEIRSLAANEKKRQANAESQIAQMKQSRNADRMKMEEELTKTKQEDLLTELKLKLHSNTNVMGMDRAYRKYIKLGSLPAFVIACEAGEGRQCLTDVVQHVPELVGADKSVISKYIRKLLDDSNSSDKENESKENGINVNGDTKLSTLQSLLMCTSDAASCQVHNPREQWYYVQNQEELDTLLDSLNKRGAREAELRMAIEQNYAAIVKMIMRTPKSPSASIVRTRFSKEDNFGCAEDMEIEQVLARVLTDNILDLEERLHNGNLGGIVDERAEFRRILEQNKVNRIEHLVRARNKKLQEYLQSNCVMLDARWHTEPDEYLWKGVAARERQPELVAFLATALVQVAMSVKPQFLFKPLGGLRNPRLRMHRKHGKCLQLFWETSLMDSSNYSELLLYLAIFEDSVMWSKSVLEVRCNTCKKARDDHNILLCDYCNDGYHLYCLKPKLTEVPKDEWFCVTCVALFESQRSRNGDEIDVDSEVGPKECNVCGYPETEDSLNCVICMQVFHMECTSVKRSMRAAFTCDDCKNAALQQQAAAQQQQQRRSGRTNDASDGMPLNNAALQELLRDVMKHEDGWPFVRPVPKNEVPDYYVIITKPMDFGKIKYKLNMGNYHYDDELIADCQLVFQNCHTYNSPADEVYKCGKRLMEFFKKRCKEIKLDHLIDFSMDDDDEEQEEEEQQEQEEMIDSHASRRRRQKH